MSLKNFDNKDTEIDNTASNKLALESIKGNKMQKAFQDILEKISFTLDVWTLPFTKSFLVIIAYYINKN
ncbi:hypothetical protein C1645_830903 [Glomus cerebriforme]|uniref:Uncharacterized protein n=1 Tax=Glomus cerebriforme TaxID=658196 RepID=A0A397SR80_9GLOM|nr:hypothetical protein C1645_830903 [Glomus cerebriforme]